MKIRRKPETVAILLLLLMISCSKAPVPKPRGYFRIDLPAKEYAMYDGKAPGMPCSFEYPVYGKLTTAEEGKKESGWFNIEFPGYRARIYLTYKGIHDDFGAIMEQTYTMNVKNHITKADAINEQVFKNDDKKVYGVLYDLKGNTASAVQFYATDSTKNYLRGSLYFSAEPNPDSLAPVINFFREDIIHLMETLHWK